MKLGEFQVRLQNLALKVENAWSLQEFSPDSFPQIAFEELSRFHERPAFDAGSLLDEIQDIELPLQNFPNREFSDFPLTLVRREKFLIDMYVWLRSDTSIHNHHFSGAFKVLKGSSFQVNYKFISHRVLGESLEEGKLERLAVSHLQKGAVEKILYHDQFIHQVLHLEQPTITLCVRTPPSEENALAVYLYPKYRLLLRDLSLAQQKWLQALNLVHNFEKQRDKKIPLSDCEVLRLIYQNHLRPGFLSPQVFEYFQRHLASVEFAQDFLELMRKQDSMTNKLKKFAFITDLNRKPRT